jgi:hypothetical protein
MKKSSASPAKKMTRTMKMASPTKKMTGAMEKTTRDPD